MYRKYEITAFIAIDAVGKICICILLQNSEKKIGKDKKGQMYFTFPRTQFQLIMCEVVKVMIVKSVVASMSSV